MSLEQYAKEKYPFTRYGSQEERAAFLSGCELMRKIHIWAADNGFNTDDNGQDCWYDSSGEAHDTNYVITLYLAQRGEQKEKG